MNNPVLAVVILLSKGLKKREKAWIGHQSFVTTTFQSHLAEMRLLSKPSLTLQQGTQEPVVQSEQKDITPQSHLRFQENSCKNVKSQLQIEIQQVIIDIAQSHYLGNRLSGHSVNAIKSELNVILDKYTILQP